MRSALWDEGSLGWMDDPPHLTADLEGEGTSISRARHLAADFLAQARAERGVEVSGRTADLTQLVVSELVTNACKYAPGPIRMELRILGDRVEVSVWDRDPALPVVRPQDAARIGQHGLEMLGVRTLVIVADLDGEAIGIYRRLGFADVERQLMMERRSGEWASPEA